MKNHDESCIIIYPHVLFMLPVGMFMFAAHVFCGVRGSKRASLQPTKSLAGGQCKPMVPGRPTGKQKILGKCHLHVRYVKLMLRVGPFVNMNVQNHYERRGREESQVHKKSKQCSPWFPNGLPCFLRYFFSRHAILTFLVKISVILLHDTVLYKFFCTVGHVPRQFCWRI